MRSLLLIALVGCEHGQTPPGSDGSLSDGGTTGCLPDLLIEGELIDWDSSDAAFQGVFGATLTQVGNPSVTLTTAPNGRLSLCAGRADPFLFTVAAGADDHLSGTLTIEPNVVLGAFRPLSFRILIPVRAATFFDEQGLTFDPDAAQIVVLQTGDRAELTLSGTHDPTQAGDDSTGAITWSAGASGRYVLFPNVTPGANVQLAGDPLGPRPILAVAGEVSLVAINFVLE